MIAIKLIFLLLYGFTDYHIEFQYTVGLLLLGYFSSSHSYRIPELDFLSVLNYY